MRIKVVLLYYCLTICHLSFAQQRCYISVKDGVHANNPPLIIHGSNPPSHYYPDSDLPTDLTFNQGDQFYVVCPGRIDRAGSEVRELGNILVNGNPTYTQSALVQCYQNDEFYVNGIVVSFEDISCAELPRSSYSAIMRLSPQSCDNGVQYDVGYDLGNFGFLLIMQLCHDSSISRTLWAYAVIQPNNQDSTRFSCSESRSFKTGFLYDNMGMSQNGPYHLQTAYYTLQQLIGVQGVLNYLSPNPRDRRYLARGHLIACADLLFKREQDATYHYANVVPMWQAINAQPGNWYLVEEIVRQAASALQRPLEVWSGGLGILQIQGSDFFLYEGDKIPVPKVLFKCVVDQPTQHGICFLVANNPYIRNNAINQYEICQRSRMCDHYSTSFDVTNSGYAYCCSLNDFYQATIRELGNELQRFRHYAEMVV